ncbi:TIR-like protein FxsC [Streptomyces naphthomycinicus]|uniref:TIR-like protein FxsC n=1 Tax=Streptomyces naphthomycinicus TaxID=2872625 RepID=UPI001CED9068|nr:TIR-like protein FxsC [Streptomyces sp. TML10]
MPLFFLSYSRKDAVDPYLDRFYTDLCRELSIYGGFDMETVGFLDRKQTTGAVWPATTGEALATCQVFVPVYSPHYFASPACGQEWHAFSARAAAHHRRTGSQPRSIVPVWWAPVPEVPPVARFLMDTRDVFGDEHKERGLRFLAQLNDNADLYKRVVAQYTKTIIEAAGSPPDPRPIPDLLSVPNAFAPAETATTPHRSAADPAGRGFGKVTFALVVGNRQAMVHVTHTELDLYGDDWSDWRPYHPQDSDSVAVSAQGVAYTRKLVSSVRSADDSLFTLLEGNAEREGLVVVIVDPWSVGLDVYQELLARLNRTRSRNSAILVPCALDQIREDPRGGVVYDQLYARLGNWMEAGDGSYHGNLPSLAHFERVLAQILIEIQARLMRMADVMRRLDDSGPGYRPILTGPGGAGS